MFWFHEGAVVLCYHGNTKKEAKLRTHVQEIKEKKISHHTVLINMINVKILLIVIALST